MRKIPVEVHQKGEMKGWTSFSIRRLLRKQGMSEIECVAGTGENVFTGKIDNRKLKLLQEMLEKQVGLGEIEVSPLERAVALWVDGEVLDKVHSSLCLHKPTATKQEVISLALEFFRVILDGEESD